MRNAIARRVRRGATLLDRERPDWFDEIDTETLNVYYTEVCPLGQLYGHYEDGLDALNLYLPWRYGFIRSPFSRFLHEADGTEAITEYTMLTAAWLAEILTRREADAGGLRLVGDLCRTREVPVAANQTTGAC